MKPVFCAISGLDDCGSDPGSWIHGSGSGARGSGLGTGSSGDFGSRIPNPESRQRSLLLRPLLQRDPARERRLQFRPDGVDARQHRADVLGRGLVELGGRGLVLQALPFGLERFDVRRQGLELAAFLELQFPFGIPNP